MSDYNQIEFLAKKFFPHLCPEHAALCIIAILSNRRKVT